jgi:hypothetical protein
MDFQEIVGESCFLAGIKKLKKNFTLIFLTFFLSETFFQENEENFIHKIIARDSRK